MEAIVDTVPSGGFPGTSPLTDAGVGATDVASEGSERATAADGAAVKRNRRALVFAGFAGIALVTAAALGYWGYQTNLSLHATQSQLATAQSNLATSQSDLASSRSTATAEAACVSAFQTYSSQVTTISEMQGGLLNSVAEGSAYNTAVQDRLDALNLEVSDLASAALAAEQGDYSTANSWLAGVQAAKARVTADAATVATTVAAWNATMSTIIADEAAVSKTSSCSTAASY